MCQQLGSSREFVEFGCGRVRAVTEVRARPVEPFEVSLRSEIETGCCNIWQCHRYCSALQVDGSTGTPRREYIVDKVGHVIDIDP